MDTLINQLIDNNIRVSSALLKARSFAMAYADDDFLNYIDNELNGYTAETPLPDYRIIGAPLVATTKTAFGHVMENIPVDMANLTEHLGIDASKIHFYDGITFFENTIQASTTDFLLRPLPTDLVLSLGSVLKNQNLRLVSAAYKFRTMQLIEIVDKVRLDLVLRLQNLNSKNVSKPKKEAINSAEKSKETGVEETKDDIFISYAWEDEDHNDKVISFVDFLRQNGYHAKMDKLKSQEETSIDFNQMMLQGLSLSNKVIIVLSPQYKIKADKFEGGVGKEYRVVLDQIDKIKNKYILVSFQPLNKQIIDAITPDGLAAREIIDLKADQDQNKFSRLFTKLNGTTVIEFSDVASNKPEIKPKTIKPFEL